MKSFLTKTYTNAVRDLTALGGFSLTVLLPLLLLDGKPIMLLIMVYLGLFLLEIVISLIKYLFFKHRPVPEEYVDNFDKIFCSSSFPSSHVSRSTFLFLALFSIYDYAYIFLIPILLVMITRYLLNKHYILDIVAGLAISIVFSALYWYIVFNYLMV